MKQYVSGKKRKKPKRIEMMEWLWNRTRAADNRVLLWKWRQAPRMEQHTRGREIIRLVMVVVSAAKCYGWSSQTSSLYYCWSNIASSWFSYMALRMKGKSVLPFHLKFISICQVGFIPDIVSVPWYVCQSLLVKRIGWLLRRHHQTSFKDTMLAFEAKLLHTS